MTQFDASIDLISCPQAPGQIFMMTSTLQYIQGSFPRSRKTKGGLSGAFASQLVWFNKSAEAGKTALVGVHGLATLGL
jgi:hypothetical protein